MMTKAKSIWINDMYWLFMPFKLTDPGVQLVHMRIDTLDTGHIADVIALTFDDVGDTPSNKYEIYVDQSDHLIKKWDFYADRKQEKPSRSWPWDNYKSYGNLKLSANRSDKGGPTNVIIYESLPDSTFLEL